MQHLVPDAAELLDEPDTSAEPIQSGTRGGTLPPPLPSPRRPEPGSLVHVGPSVSPRRPAQRALAPEMQLVVVERSSWLGLGALLVVAQIVGTVIAVVVVTGWRPSEPSPAKVSVNSLVAAPEPQSVTAKPVETAVSPVVQTTPVPASITMPAPVRTPAPIARRSKLRAAAPAPAPTEEAPATPPEPVAARDRLFDSMF